MADVPSSVGDLLYGEGNQTWSDYAREGRYFWAADVLARIDALLGEAAPEYASGWLEDDGQGPTGSAVVISGSTVILATVKPGERPASGPRQVDVATVALPLSVISEVSVTRSQGLRADLVMQGRDTVHLPLPPYSMEPSARLLKFLPSLVQRLGR